MHKYLYIIIAAIIAISLGMMMRGYSVDVVEELRGRGGIGRGFGRHGGFGHGGYYGGYGGGYGGGWGNWSSWWPFYGWFDCGGQPCPYYFF